jgi:hypothetical protein
MFGLQSVHLKYVSILKNNFKNVETWFGFRLQWIRRRRWVLKCRSWTIRLGTDTLGRPTETNWRSSDRWTWFCKKYKKYIWIDIYKKKIWIQIWKKPTLKIKVILKIQFEMKFMMKINWKGNFKIFRVNNIQAFNLSNA